MSEQHPAIRGREQESSLNEHVFYPRPKYFHSLELEAYLPAKPLKFTCSPAAADLAERFLAAAECSATVEISNQLSGFSMTANLSAKLPTKPTHPGGYNVRGDADGISCVAADKDGCYSGLQALLPLLDARARPLRPFELRDWPAVATRGFQIDLGRQPENAGEIKRLLRQQARYRYNQCQLYLENSIQLDAFGAAADPHGLTVEEFREVQRFGADLGIDVVPSLNLLGHVEKLLRHAEFAPLSEVRHGARNPEQDYDGCLCPELPEARTRVAAIVAEICRLSDSPRLMVGLDECWTLGSHPLTRKRMDSRNDVGAAFRDWIRFLHAEVTRHGKRMWMWEDMLFYYQGVLGEIPADIGMQEWHYQQIESLPHYSFQNWRRIDAMGQLTAHGHPVMLCCGPDPEHLESMLRYAEGRPLDGILVVQWGGGPVQEIYHLRRALAAGVLWTGQKPDSKSVIRAVTGCGEDRGERMAVSFERWLTAPLMKGGGSSTCPRFWAWPENAAARSGMEDLAARWNGEHGGEAWAAVGQSLDARAAAMSMDVARENIALTGRQMLQHALRESAVLDRWIAVLEAAIEQWQRAAAAGNILRERYRAGLAERRRAATSSTLADLRSSVLAFQSDPCRATWPFPCFSLHVDGLVIDPCSHRIDLRVGDDGNTWETVHAGQARLPPTLEGEFTTSIPLTAQPRFVRLEIGGFAALAITRLRLETLDGTLLPTRVVSVEGTCRDPELLLEFDRKFAVFNPADVLSNWRRIGTRPGNVVVLEFAST